MNSHPYHQESYPRDLLSLQVKMYRENICRSDSDCPKLYSTLILLFSGLPLSVVEIGETDLLVLGEENMYRSLCTPTDNATRTTA